MDMTWMFTLLVACIRPLFVDGHPDDFILTKIAAFGSALVVHGRTIDEPSSIIMSTKGFCNCRMICFTKIDCTMVSMKTNSDGSIECRFSEEDILTISLTKEEEKESFLFVKTKKFTEFFGQDGMFYFLEKQGLTRDEGKKYCADFPNGRMAMAKTLKQWQSLFDFRKSLGFIKDNHYFLLDLASNGNSDELIFGDGTNYAATELSEYVDPENLDTNLQQWNSAVLESRTMDGKQLLLAQKPDHTSWIICQINPLKEE